jgi:hypothetical protein
VNGSSRRGWVVGLTVLAALGCSRDSGRQAQSTETSPSPNPSSRRVPACSLLTSAEVAQAVGRSVANVVAQDTLFEPGYWSSTCIFALAPAAGRPGVLTVAASGDFPTVADAAELADAVSAEAMGISAVPLPGMALPAALYPDTGVVIQKGTERLLVSGLPREVITPLATTAAARLP